MMNAFLLHSFFIFDEHKLLKEQHRHTIVCLHHQHSTSFIKAIWSCLLPVDLLGLGRLLQILVLLQKVGPVKVQKLTKIHRLIMCVLAQLSSCSVDRVFSKLERIRKATGEHLKEDMCEVRLLLQCNGTLDAMYNALVLKWDGEWIAFIFLCL